MSLGSPTVVPGSATVEAGRYLVTGRGVPFHAGAWLAQGGQGVIFEVLGRPDLVFKRYKPAELIQDVTLRDRLEVMCKLQPAAWRHGRSQHVMLAWPTESVFDETGFVGYLMPRIDAERSARLLRVWDPSDREVAEPPTEWLREFDWRFLVATGSNLALGLEALHASDVVIGDFNDANVAVTPGAGVTFFDCDSMQLSDAETRRQFLCRVTRPEFTAPELMGVDFQTTPRTQWTDLFALAVHLYQLLLQGEHPFRGQWHGEGDPPREQMLARGGLWTYAGRPELTPRPTAIGIEVLPREIAELFRRAFVDGARDPSSRPSAMEWRNALEQLGSALICCNSAAQHWFPSSFRQCPWCRDDRLKASRARAADSSGRPGRGHARVVHVVPPMVGPITHASGDWPEVATSWRSAAKMRKARQQAMAAAGWSLAAHRRRRRRSTLKLLLLCLLFLVAVLVVLGVTMGLLIHFDVVRATHHWRQLLVRLHLSNLVLPHKPAPHTHR